MRDAAERLVGMRKQGIADGAIGEVAHEGYREFGFSRQP